MAENKNILALYDCRSKQEYIYRTNRVQEITGASELLSSLFKDFSRKRIPGSASRETGMKKRSATLSETLTAAGLMQR